jgi:peptide-methionine (S)-S-oxide reductase
VLISLNTYAAIEAAVFGMGNFWAAQADFEKLPGVITTVVGYDGGNTPNPTYYIVSHGRSNYKEAVLVIFNPDKVTYSQVLSYFWIHIDPTIKNAQFCDHGKEFQSTIFYLNQEQQEAASASLAKLHQQQPKMPIYTDISPSTTFYKAEAYNQYYYRKNPLRYNFYRWRCGRDKRLQQVWREHNYTHQ